MTEEHYSSTKPYLLRALYEWCTDNGLTPYLVVKVDAFARVPMEYVKDGEIVLNISFDATHKLEIDNTGVSFSARFGGVSRDIAFPVGNVLAIYSRETGQGMTFPFESQAAVDDKTEEVSSIENESSEAKTSPQLASVATTNNATTESMDTPTEKNSRPSGKPSLKVVK